MIGFRRRQPAVGWPAWLVAGSDPAVVVRPIDTGDIPIWQDVRRANATWLVRWDATVPPGGDPRPTSYRSLVRRLNRLAEDGTTLPFAIEIEGRFVGQVTINNIVRGSAQFASVGYWIDHAYAGRGITPLAVAMVIDHCFTTVGLHRIEICIRPENTNSLRVVEKLGLNEVGYAPRFLHIDGDWRDHRIYAITKEEVPLGLVKRLQGTRPAG